MRHRGELSLVAAAALLAAAGCAEKSTGSAMRTPAAPENAVNRIEGVERVEDRIAVLPLSSNDDRMRVAVYRAIYGQAPWRGCSR